MAMGSNIAVIAATNTVVSHHILYPLARGWMIKGGRSSLVRLCEVTPVPRNLSAAEVAKTAALGRVVFLGLLARAS